MHLKSGKKLNYFDSGYLIYLFVVYFKHFFP
jgi:hypothetical protein